MKKFLICLLLPITCLAGNNGPYPVPGGGSGSGTITTNSFFFGTNIAYVNNLTGSASGAIGDPTHPFSSLVTAVNTIDMLGGGTVVLTAGQTNYISSQLNLTNIYLSAYGASVVCTTNFSSTFQIFAYKYTEIHGGNYLVPAYTTSSSIANLCDDLAQSKGTKIWDSVFENSKTNLGCSCLALGGGPAGATNSVQLFNCRLQSCYLPVGGGDPRAQFSFYDCQIRLNATAGYNPALMASVYLGQYEFYNCYFECTNAIGDIWAITVSGSTDSILPAGYRAHDCVFNLKGAATGQIIPFSNVSGVGGYYDYDNCVVNGQSYSRTLCVLQKNQYDIQVSGFSPTNLNGHYTFLNTNPINGFSVWTNTMSTNIFVFNDIVNGFKYVFESDTNQDNLWAFSASSSGLQGVWNQSDGSFPSSFLYVDYQLVTNLFINTNGFSVGSFISNTNDMVPGTVYVGPNSRFNAQVAVTGTATIGTPFQGMLMYSNSATGNITPAAIFPIPSGIGTVTETNTLYLNDANPSSMYWITNTGAQLISVPKNNGTRITPIL